ncbi:MAG: anthranilate synthase component I family protein [Lewinellaceae bacterium]|nr:anthranilate synthase component I family protein [Lewinellaceae bacterium]
MRQTAVFSIDNIDLWKRRLLHWAAGHTYAVFLDSNGAVDQNDQGAVADNWECLVAAGAIDVLEAGAGKAFEALHRHLEEEWNGDWCFGFFGYDLKNEVERLESHRFDGIGLPDIGFFRPAVVAGIRSGRLEIQSIGPAPDEIFDVVSRQPLDHDNPEKTPAHASVALLPRISKPEYLRKVEAIRQHIAEGDVYEMNLCQEFYAEQALPDPLAVFERLNAFGRSPFATFMRWRDRYLLSASPERFLKKTGQTLISQPIKGTRRRGDSPAADEANRRDLQNSQKDRAENVMIVDLVRNDLARHCEPGSVQVDELFGIYTFRTVHQMISTVRGTLRAGIHPIDALRSAFPPGSMTGAPKVMAMELIERYEHTRRGLYSGGVGYMTPGGDFDFNVVIRSILYNAASQYISVQVGGAIVYDSEPEQEYEECLLKAEAMIRALKG